MTPTLLNAIVVLNLIEYDSVMCSELCELGCEESDLDLYLEECRNGCNAEPDLNPTNKMDEYLNCMHKSCLASGRGPKADIYLDETWLECSHQCDRQQMLSAHEATERPVFHTQYLSDRQLDNYRLISKLESKAKSGLRKKQKHKKSV